MMRVIGLMSGTSVDGVDAVLVEITGQTTDLAVTLLDGQTVPYPNALRDRILAVCGGEAMSMEALAELDDTIAHTFAQAACNLQPNSHPASLIGSHGQTVYHRPMADTDASGQNKALGYSLQLGRGAVIACETGVPTVSNFRGADIAMVGQGAPLVPAVDRYVLGHPTLSRCIQNIGGIGNVAYVPPLDHSSGSSNTESGNAESGSTESGNTGSGNAVHHTSDASLAGIGGWDTGPGNVLIDLAVQRFSGGMQHYDANGRWAAQGTICYELVNQWLQHPFFHQPPPKSTGRELFGPAYLEQCLQASEARGLDPADSLATLTELTAASIHHSYHTYLPQHPDQILVCGGGSHNGYLMERLRSRFDPIPVLTTDDSGMSSSFKEAIAFGVLAYWRWLGIPSNVPAVTGAAHSISLGDIYLPPQLSKTEMASLMAKIIPRQ